MTDTTTAHSAGAIRAAKQIRADIKDHVSIVTLDDLDEIIDHETNAVANFNKMAAKIRDDYPDGWPDREQPYGFEGCYKLPDWLVRAAKEFDISQGFSPGTPKKEEATDG